MSRSVVEKFSGQLVSMYITYRPDSRNPSLSSVFLGEVYDLRLHPGGGNFRPPLGGVHLGLRGSLTVLPALAVTPLYFGDLDLSTGWSPMVAHHSRLLSGSRRVWIRVICNVKLKGTNFCAEVVDLRFLRLFRTGF